MCKTKTEEFRRFWEDVPCCTFWRSSWILESQRYDLRDLERRFFRQFLSALWIVWVDFGGIWLFDGAVLRSFCCKAVGGFWCQRIQKPPEMITKPNFSPFALREYSSLKMWVQQLGYGGSLRSRECKTTHLQENLSNI